MLNKKFKYTLIALTVLGLSGCNQRSIIIHPEESAVETASTQPVVKSPEIKEEILINKNPNLGQAVTIPINDPSLGQVITDENDYVEKAPVVVKKNHRMERISFPVSEYNRIKKTGGSTVSGSVYLHNSHNEQKIMGKKVKLYLNPVTSYSRQWYQQSYLGGYKMSKSDKRLYNYLKYTVSNSSGKFNFFGVARGKYYLTGTVTCGEECGFSKSKTLRLVREISVGSGVTKTTLMKHVP